VISVRNLEAGFGGNPVVSGISFEVPEKDCLVLLGRNGCGKSVLLKAVAGLLPAKGFVELAGRRPGPELFRGVDGRVVAAYVFQKGGLFDSMNVYDNIAFGVRRLGRNESAVEKSVLSALERVGLAGSEQKLPSELSGGMQKRGGLARAVCMHPQVIFYDDPTAGLDPLLTDSIALLLNEIRQRDGITSIAITHDLVFAQIIADSIILLEKGRMLCHLSRDEFFSGHDEAARQFMEGLEDGPIRVFE
jgi:phospholipid/cholesterol/gamma-HCH transport system ATP-binding protein